MTMCSSGSIGIISCPQGAGSSLAFEVCGSVASPPYSLCGLATAAGISLSSGMTGFYGYSSTPNPYFLESLVTGSGAFCEWCSSCGSGITTSNTCACICVGWEAGVNGTSLLTRGIACVYCNTVAIGGCGYCCNQGGGSGSFSFVQDADDIVCYCTIGMSKEGTPYYGWGCLSIISVTNITGNYCKGTPNSQLSAFGIIP